jgi:hypothetical protein
MLLKPDGAANVTQTGPDGPVFLYASDPATMANRPPRRKNQNPASRPAAAGNYPAVSAFRHFNQVLQIIVPAVINIILLDGLVDDNHVAGGNAFQHGRKIAGDIAVLQCNTAAKLPYL